MISVVIPSFKRKESLAQLLDDLKVQEGVSYEVIVVDDKSPDDTLQYTRSNYPWVISLVNEVNSGPTVSRNYGIREAKGELLVGIDSDVRVPDKHFLKKIQDSFEQNKPLTGISIRILEGDGTTDDAPRWWHPLPIEKYNSKRFETNYFSGTSFAFRTKELKTAGMFPAILFQFYEEVEVCYRIIDNGGRIVYDPDISVLHFPGPRPDRDKKRYYYNLRNQILMSVACFPFWYSLKFLIPRFSYYLIKTTLTGDLPIFLKAIRDAKRISKQRLKERKVLKPDTLKKMKAMRRYIAA